MVWNVHIKAFWYTNDIINLVLPLDVCDSTALEPAFQKVSQTFGPIDVLLLNAGR